MAVNYRSISSNSISGTSLTITLPAGLVDGDLMIALLVHATGNVNALDGAAPAGWLQETVINNSECNIGVWTKIAAGESNPTFNWTTNNECAGTLIAVSDPHQTISIAVNAEHYQAQTTTSTTITNNATSTADNTLLVFIVTRDTTAAETLRRF